jgi:hypothetical protein
LQIGSENPEIVFSRNNRRDELSIPVLGLDKRRNLSQDVRCAYVRIQ